MSDRFFICGYSTAGLSQDEQQKFDEHLSIWSKRSWESQPYNIYDKRDQQFEGVLMSLEEDMKSRGDKLLIIFGEVFVSSSKEMDQVLEALSDLKNRFAAIHFEAYSEEKRIA